MAITIDSGFNQFLAALRFSQRDTLFTASHRASIKAKLEQACGITAFFRSGSFGNGTHVAPYSDVDYFAVIPSTRRAFSSSETLSHVARALRERYPLTVGIRVNGPAVRVPFGLGGAQNTEIVPVVQTGQTRLGFRQFDIPDGGGRWMFSSPESHNEYVRNIDEKKMGRVKPLIRFLKAWKYARGVPVRSFYLEAWTAAYASHEPAIVWSIDIAQVLERMLAQGLVDVVDPRFNDQIICPCNTEAQRQEALIKLRRAAQWARQAVDHEHLGYVHTAFERWNMMFNGTFPDYTSR